VFPLHPVRHLDLIPHLSFPFDIIDAADAFLVWGMRRHSADGVSEGSYSANRAYGAVSETSDYFVEEQFPSS